MDEIIVGEALRGKNILLTGASGFLGKVWLCMALARIPQIGKVYVLLRSKSGLTAKQRLERIVNTSPVFSVLHETYQDRLGSFLSKHLQAIEGDISQPDFGLGPSLVSRLSGQVDLILNCAGLVEFTSDLRAAFRANVDGPLHAARLAQTLDAALLHVSTAYVTGSRDGEIGEEAIPNFCPSGKNFDAALEYSEIENLTRSDGEKSWVELGQARANQWGWPNTYAYTKSLGESLLLERAEKGRLSLFRPTIIESSLRFPFPGWNEGITTCAPLSYFASQGLRFFQMKPRYTLDLIPVDLVCEGITVATAALLEGKAKPVYHCGTSHRNPLSQRFAMDLMNLNHREYFQANGKGFFEKLYLSRSHPTIVDERSFFTASNFRKLTSIAIELTELAMPHLPPVLQGPLQKGKKALKKIKWDFTKAERVQETFKPFLLLYDYVFKTENLKSHRVREADFQFQPERISWSEYIVNIHEPGLRKWCYPLIEGKPVEEHRPVRPCLLPADDFIEKASSSSGPEPEGLRMISKTG